MSHSGTLKKKRERTEPASGWWRTGVCQCVDKHALRHHPLRQVCSRHREEPTEAPCPEGAQSHLTVSGAWVATVPPIMPPWLCNCSRTHPTDLHQGTGMAVLIGYPTTCCFPAAQGLPLSTSPFSMPQLPFQELLTLSASKPCAPSHKFSPSPSQTTLFPSSSQKSSLHSLPSPHQGFTLIPGNWVLNFH